MGKPVGGQHSPVIETFAGKTPKIHHSAFVAPTAIVLGDVEIAEQASIWYHCIIDGRRGPIRIGDRSNVQDHSRLTVTDADHSILIGDDVLIGHSVTLFAGDHDCILETESFVGIYAHLSGSIVQGQAIIAARARVRPGNKILTGEMWGGDPAVKIRNLKSGEDSWAKGGCTHYVREAAIHKAALEEAGKL